MDTPRRRGRNGSVRLEVARDAGFGRVVARETIRTGESLGHTVKARIGGLKPRERYYYRFETRGGESTVGRFATAAPLDSDEPVRFAFFSCQDYPHGYYNAHDLLAREDLDFVVDLGDYIYAETYYSKAKGTGVRDDRIGRVNPRNPLIVREAVTLEDYRDKYRLVRSDPALRRVHARFPIVSIWDDHEVQDKYAGGAARGGLAPGKRFSQARRRAGVRAFFESMPLYASGGKDGRVYRAFRFGRTVDLILLDERQYREDQPCGDSPGPACADLDSPRTFLGPTQLAWAKRRLESSKAAWRSSPTRSWSCRSRSARPRSPTTTRGTATPGSAASCCSTSATGRSGTSPSSPATSTRSSPATCRSGRAPTTPSRSSSSAARSLRPAWASSGSTSAVARPCPGTTRARTSRRA